MAYRPTVVCDVDGVLLDIHHQLERRICRLNPLFRMSSVLTYDFNKSLESWHNLGLEEGLVERLFSDLALYKASSFDKEMCSSLIKLANNCNVVIYTLSSTKEIADWKYKTLDNIFREHNLKIGIKVAVGDEKVALPSADYVIEDSIENIAKYPSKTKGLLINKSYNRPLFNKSYSKVFKRCTRVKDIEQAVDEILYDIGVCVEELKIS